jgi:hypothetical protein
VIPAFNLCSDNVTFKNLLAVLVGQAGVLAHGGGVNGITIYLVRNDAVIIGFIYYLAFRQN